MTVGEGERRDDEETSAALVEEAATAVIASAPARPRMRILIDCGEVPDGVPEDVLVSIAAEATQAARGRVHVASSDLVIDGRTVEVYRA